MRQDEVAALIKQNKKNPDLILKTLDERKVDFDLNRDIEKKLRKKVSPRGGKQGEPTYKKHDDRGTPGNGKQE